MINREYTHRGTWFRIKRYNDRNASYIVQTVDGPVFGMERDLITARRKAIEFINRRTTVQYTDSNGDDIRPVSRIC